MSNSSMQNKSANFTSIFAGTLLGLVIAAVLGRSEVISVSADSAQNIESNTAINTQVCDELDSFENQVAAYDVIAAPRAINQVLKTGLTDEERRWLSDNEQTSVDVDFTASPELVDAMLDEVMWLENNATRRYLIQALKQLDAARLKNVVYQLADSNRAIDQESAIEIAIELSALTADAQLILDLFYVDLAPSAQLQLIFAFNQQYSQLNPLDFYPQLLDVYQAASDANIKSAVVHALSFSAEVRDLLFPEILSLMQNDFNQTELQGLRSIQQWVESYAVHFNQEQKLQLKQYSDNLYALSDSYEKKKIAIQIGGAI
ncbi:hypothetical protein [Catenovulum agarivorans]|uniref:hypothetical protein n=1 Tax=Catenovulum agarivorans TaxID=1172192 RepID=UPI00030FEAC2|nr:hypothetical protein [Catenovulum agarivorans]